MRSVKGSISSGEKLVSSQILDREGWFLGATLTGGGTDATVKFFDSADGNDGSKTLVGFISKDIPHIEKESHCREGIYAEIAEGAEYIVEYTI